MSSGMRRISLTFAVSCSAAVTHVVPSPRARRARQKLQAAWITESNRPGRPLPSWRPMTVGMTMAGTSARCSARYVADAITFSLGWPVPWQPFGGGGHERQRGLAVELAELVLDPLVADDDPSPAAEVAAGRCLLGEVDAVEQQLVVDRPLEVEPPAHRSCRGEHLVDLGDVEAHVETRSTVGTSLGGCRMDARSEAQAPARRV